MKKVISSLILAGALSTANANNIVESENFKNFSEGKNVCNSEMVVKNAKNRVFALIEGAETKKNTLTYCKNGEKIFKAKTVTGKPHKDGGTYTPEGTFLAGNLIKNKTSGSYKGKNGKPAKMPNAVHVHKGIWIHAGKTLDKNGELLKYASHGCIRLSHADSERFFNQVKNDKNIGEKVEIIIKGTKPKK